MKRTLLSIITNPIVSLDIGSHSIKLVEGKYTGNSVTIQKAVTIPTPAEAIRDGKLMDISKLREVINTLIKREKVKAKDLVFTIESTAVITREIILPTTKPQEIEAMLEFELEQYLPIALENYSIQKKILDEFQEHGVRKSHIMVAALPKEIVNEYLALCDSLGLKPRALDLSSNSMYKLVSLKGFLGELNDISNKTIAILDIGHSYSNLIVIKRGILKFNRLMHFGGREINYNIANSFNLTIEEAEAKKKEVKSLNLIGADEISSAAMLLNIVKESVDNWIRDIDRLFKYFLSRESGNKIDEIYLCGGSSKLKGLDTYIKNEFQTPTYNLRDTIEGKYSSGVLDKNLESYLNAVGAIIRR